MCSAPNVYMFVYILIGTHMVPLKLTDTAKVLLLPVKLANQSAIQVLISTTQ